MKNYTMHSDPGHAWLEVEFHELHKLGIANDISTCSYRQGDLAYLEEDCDAPLFLRAAGFLDGPRLDYSKINLVESFRENTPVRNYPSYWSA